MSRVNITRQSKIGETLCLSFTYAHDMLERSSRGIFKAIRLSLSFNKGAIESCSEHRRIFAGSALVYEELCFFVVFPDDKCYQGCWVTGIVSLSAEEMKDEAPEMTARKSPGIVGSFTRGGKLTRKKAVLFVVSS